MLTSQLHSLQFFVCDTGFNRNSCFWAVTCNVTTGVKVTQKWQFHVHMCMWSHYVKKHMLKQVCSAGCSQRTSSKGRKLWTFSFTLISLSFPHVPPPISCLLHELNQLFNMDGTVPFSVGTIWRKPESFWNPRRWARVRPCCSSGASGKAAASPPTAAHWPGVRGLAWSRDQCTIG